MKIDTLSLQEIIQSLKEIVGHSELITEESDQTSYNIDWRKKFQKKVIAIVFPQNNLHILSLISFCQQQKINLTPQGGNTSMCAAAIPTHSKSIILNFKKMNRVIDYNPQDRYITMECGCTLDQAEIIAQKDNMKLPISLQPKNMCQIGGIVATNAGGLCSIRYGMIRSHILGLEVILSNGDVLNMLRPIKKQNAGYDLKQLFIGSEGTLGIITKVCIALHPEPLIKKTVWISCENLKEVLYHVSHLQRNIDSIEKLELVDQQSLDLIKEFFPSEAKAIPSTGPWQILLEHNAPHTIHLENIKAIEHESNSVTGKKLWEIRKKIPLAERISGTWIKHDISVPFSKLEEFLKHTKDSITKKYPLARFICFGHIGDGNLHYNVQTEIHHQESQAIINKIIYDYCEKYKGSFSAEHGIGQLKRSELKNYRPIEYKIMCKIKKALDPQGLLNQNIILHAEDIET